MGVTGGLSGLRLSVGRGGGTGYASTCHPLHRLTPGDQCPYHPRDKVIPQRTVACPTPSKPSSPPLTLRISASPMLDPHFRAKATAYERGRARNADRRRLSQTEKEQKGIRCGRARGIDQWHFGPSREEIIGQGRVLHCCGHRTGSIPSSAPPPPPILSPHLYCQRLCIGQAEVDALPRQRVHRINAPSPPASLHLPVFPPSSPVRGERTRPCLTVSIAGFTQVSGAFQRSTGCWFSS